jgi:peroxiredoxin
MRTRILPGSCLSLLLLAATCFSADIPRKAPEFAIDTNSGKQILLSQARGKVVALAFILTTCPHCQHTVQILTKLQNEYGPRGFQVLASAIEDNAGQAVPDFTKRFQPSFPVGFNKRDSVLEFLQHPVMLRLLMPQLVFIDRQGTIRAQYSGDDNLFSGDQEKNLRDQIETLLKEGSPNGTAQKKTVRARKKTS